MKMGQSEQHEIMKLTRRIESLEAKVYGGEKEYLEQEAKQGLSEFIFKTAKEQEKYRKQIKGDFITWYIKNILNKE